MSLHALATNMASQGRGPDSMLVHMAPREVAGLQSLAMAHGGSLTINPTTGLPEAGFLSNLLPTLIGAGLSIASGGALTPLMAAGITGAGYGVATGSLKKGLMAGLGAYGGAGLGSGLSAAGAAEASIPGAAPVSAEAATSFTTDPSAYNNFAPTESSFGSFGDVKTALPSAPVSSHSLFDAAGQPLNSPLAGHPMSFEAAAPAPTTPMAAPTPAPSSYTPGYGTESARNAFQSQAADATMTDNFKQAGRGLTSLMDSPAGRDAFLGTAAKDGVEATGVGGLGGLARYGSAAATPMLLDQRTGNGYKPDSEQYKYKYDVNRNPDPQGSYTGAPTGERQWFAPKFTRLYAEGGKTQTSEDALRYLTSTDPSGKTNDLTGASRQAYDYLMGNGPGYRPQIQTQSSLPTARILTEDSGGGGGPSTGGITTLPITTTDPHGDPYDPVNPVTTVDTVDTPETPETPPTQDVVEAPTREIVEPPPSIRTDPIVSDIPDTPIEPNNIPTITPTTPLDLPDISETGEPKDLVDTSFIDTTDTDEVGPPRGLRTNPAELDEDQLYAPVASTALAESANATDIDNATISVDNQTGVQDNADGSATVTLPGNGTMVQDDGTTEVITNEIANTPVVEQPTVVGTPDGGAEVSFADQDTFNPDTGTYVEVGNAGGDFGDRGTDVADLTPTQIDQINTGINDDFGKYGLGDSSFDRDIADASGSRGGFDLGGFDFGGVGGGVRKNVLQAEIDDFANGGMTPYNYAMGGLGSLGGYSDGGRLLRGPGDGVSDSIPAMIGKKQPARLADGEFVIPARIVSELGNGSTDAGARKLYQMMDRIQAARKKTTGKNRVAVNSRADKMMPV